jgi:hypothetical protein
LAPATVSLKSQFLRLWNCFSNRKAWLFADTVRGAKASMNLYSLIETCKANSVEPYAYLKHLFIALPQAQTVDDYEALLPWQIPSLASKAQAAHSNE